MPPTRPERNFFDVGSFTDFQRATSDLRPCLRCRSRPTLRRMSRTIAVVALVSALVGAAGGIAGTALMADQLSVLKGERGDVGPTGERGTQGAPGLDAPTFTGGYLVASPFSFAGSCPPGTAYETFGGRVVLDNGRAVALCRIQ